MAQFLEHLRSGGVLAYPTETVWGLGVDATESLAVEKVFALKGRESSKAMSVLVPHQWLIKDWVEISEPVERLLEIFWPGPVTFVLPVKDKHPLAGSLIFEGCVGLRCSSHPLVRDLVWGLGRPLTTTSANKSGEPPAQSPADLAWLPASVKIVQGSFPMGAGAPSIVVKVVESRYQILRGQDGAQAALIEQACDSIGLSAQP